MQERKEKEHIDIYIRLGKVKDLDPLVVDALMLSSSSLIVTLSFTIREKGILTESIRRGGLLTLGSSH